jgi:hypothetical protein
MKTRWKTPLIFAAALTALLSAGVMVSCGSTGNFMPLSSGEPVIGTIQTDFVTHNTRSRNVINTQAYIKLLEAAQGKHGQGTQIDIRDVMWVSGQKTSGINTEYSATGKVVPIP